jgi:hypothetical protein
MAETFWRSGQSAPGPAPVRPPRACDCASISADPCLAYPSLGLGGAAPGITACVPHLQTFSVPGPPANFKHSAAALSTLAKAATLQPRPLTVSIGFRNCYVARFGNPRPSRVPYILHVWSIALLGRFERSPPKLKVPNQKWTGLSTPIVKGHYTIELRLHISS